ncbi:MAG: acyltransferase [Xanthomonadales bacterium]|nr:acyltransferase [Xanthomonadales bacterium]
MPAAAYRPDIDGLRAIAVLAVVLYHFGLGGLGGGFVGVDVFFVISGYLITGIVQAEIVQGRFTLARFYERRARRIFPALFAMLASVLVAGWFLLLPSDLARLGQATVATVLFASNLLFARQAGYFDESSDFNPLLHTWSLGVEEQFYLGLPLLLLGIARWRPRALLPVLWAAALLSFGACVAGQAIKPKPVFFLSPFRAWELLVGALLAVRALPPIGSRLARELAAVVAALALLWAIGWMRADANFPGWRAAIPVLATGVLLHVGGAGGSRVHDMLAWRPLVLVGLWSYSLYLWHWPLLVLVRYRDGMEPPGIGMALLLLVGSLLLAALSHRFVETPFRGPTPAWRGTPRAVFIASAVAAACLAVAGGWLLAARGVPARVGPEVAALDALRTPTIPYQRCDGVLPDLANRACTIGAADADRVALVWGDSHALAWAPGLDGVFRERGIRGMLAVFSACGPLPEVHNPSNPRCLAHNRKVVAWLRAQRPEVVYLVAAWPVYSNIEGGYMLRRPDGVEGNTRVFPSAFGELLDIAGKAAGEVHVIGPTPYAPEFLPFKLAMRQWAGEEMPQSMTRESHLVASAHFWRTARAMHQRYPKIHFHNPTPWFCDMEACQYRAGGRVLFRDGDHLNVADARFAAQHLRESEAASRPGERR